MALAEAPAAEAPAASVTLVHRRDGFRASRRCVAKLARRCATADACSFVAGQDTALLSTCSDGR